MSGGVVVCPQQTAADIGASVLRSGGNAFDAGVAIAFTQMVIDPLMADLGGMGCLQYRIGSSKHQGCIDFYARAGSLVHPDMWVDTISTRTPISGYTVFEDYRSELGYTSVMTPGTVAGLGELHRRFGRLPWQDLVAPSAALAASGVEASAYYCEPFEVAPPPGVPDAETRVRTTEAAASTFLHPSGRPYRRGEIRRNGDLSRTLSRIASDGGAAFYRGALGNEIAEDLASHGSYVTTEDLSTYRPRSLEPIAQTYRGWNVSTAPPPGGGLTVIQLLQMLERFDLTGMGHNSAEYLDVLARCMSAAHHDRSVYVGDPEFVSVPVSLLRSKERADRLVRLIRAGINAPPRVSIFEQGTTHVCIADSDANLLTLTHTIGSGSGVVTPGLGFMYNNSMKLFDPMPGGPNSIAPGKARITGACPTILSLDNEPRLVLGAFGGSVMISAVVQTIVNIVDFGMSADQAVAAARIHCEGGPIYPEPSIDADTLAEVATRGHTVETNAVAEVRYGRSYLISLKGTAYETGVDHRGGTGGVAFA